MNNGRMFCFLGALSFGLLACASKFAERRNCQASVLVVLLFGWATLEVIRGIAQSGAKGLVFGRNVFQAENVVEFIRRAQAVLAEA